MGNRTGGSRVYHMPTFFSLKEIKVLYGKASDDIKTQMKSVIPNKTNFNIHNYSDKLIVQVYNNKKLISNMIMLATILAAESSYDNIALLTFHPQDVRLFVKQ